MLCAHTFTASANTPALPNKPGFKKSNKLHKSPGRFSTGVPVIATRASARNRFTAFVAPDPGFLIACASSKITTPHASSIHISDRCKNPYVVTTTSTPRNSLPGSLISKSNSSLAVTDACATSNRNPGANLPTSARQFPINDAGTTSKLGFLLNPNSFLRSSSAITCTVFPNPMSSAKHAPNPSRVMNISHAYPLC